MNHPHPHQLHALAALWSLRAARRHLAQAAADEARAITAEALEPADGLRSPLYAAGRGTGGHGDPSARAALDATEPTTRANRWADLAANTTTTLDWLAHNVAGRLAQDHPDPAALLTQLAGGLRSSTAATITLWARELDDRIRTALSLHHDLWPLPGNPPCPACHVRQLYAQTSAPYTGDWTVICGARCLCPGPGCPCGMDLPTAGVAHIWGRGSALVDTYARGNAA